MAICSDSDYMPFYLVITRQNMANWMIHLADEYLGVMYDYLHMKLYGFHVIQADETPVLVNKDAEQPVPRALCWYTVQDICIQTCR